MKQRPEQHDLEDGPADVDALAASRERAETMSRVMAMSGADISTARGLGARRSHR